MIYQKKAFTLIELIVWISIIWFISLWISRLYWSNIPDRQRLDIFTNKIVWVVDSVKNYSLVWKWIWVDLVTPQYFKIEISTGSYIKTYYNTWFTDILFSALSIDNFGEYYKINNIVCKNLDLTNTSSTNNIKISYQWSNISLSWCIDNYQKIVDIELFYKWFEKTLRLNTINWVLEEI
jgi:hypothetical protein